MARQKTVINGPVYDARTLGKGRIVGGIYDNRLLVKPTPAAKAYMPDSEPELPYEGAKPMLLVTEPDTPGYLTGLFEAMYSEL